MFKIRVGQEALLHSKQRTCSGKQRVSGLCMAVYMWQYTCNVNGVCIFIVNSQAYLFSGLLIHSQSLVYFNFFSPILFLRWLDSTFQVPLLQNCC